MFLKFQQNICLVLGFIKLKLFCNDIIEASNNWNLSRKTESVERFRKWHKQQGYFLFKEKIFSDLENPNTDPKQQKIHTGGYEHIGKAIF